MTLEVGFVEEGANVQFDTINFQGNDYWDKKEADTIEIEAQSCPVLQKDTLRRLNIEVLYQNNIKALNNKYEKCDTEFYKYYHKYASWRETPRQRVLMLDHPCVRGDAPVLVKAIANHDYRAVEVFLKNGADPQIRGWQSQSHYTPINLAITDNDEKMIALILQYLPEECDPITDLFIGNALQMCDLPALKLLFDKSGGVKRYLRLEIQQFNEQEIRHYNQGITRYKPRQEVQTSYGKCSSKTIEILNQVFLTAACGVQMHIKWIEAREAKRNCSFEVMKYLMAEGWPPLNNQTFEVLLDRQAPLDLFQKLLEEGGSPTTPSRMTGCNRVDVLRLVIEMQPEYLNNPAYQAQAANHFAYHHDFENYKFLLNFGVPIEKNHLSSAIRNIEKMKLDKISYLAFIQKILELGVDPNCLPEAKSTGCEEVINLLLRYGATPV